MIDPNDLFQQIGFIIETSEKSSPYKSRRQSEVDRRQSLSHFNKNYKTIEPQFQSPEYTTSLQIELSQDENHILQIRSYDNPYELASKFCKKHNLNKLAVEIVEKKIIEAKQREQQKLRNLPQQNTYASATPSKRTRNQQVPQNNCNQDFLKNTPYQNKPQPVLTKSLSKSTSKQTTSNKNIPQTKSKSNLANQQKESKSTKKMAKEGSSSTLDDACRNLYFRGMLQQRALQQKRIKRQQQKQQRQEKQLTFKPKINEVSEKIIEFRKQTGTVPPKNPNKLKQQIADQFYNQLKQCTFTPEINPISKIIVHNRSAYRNETQHFNQLFNTTDNFEEDFTVGLRERRSINSMNLTSNQPQVYQNKKSKQYLMKQKEQEEKELFKPKLNPKSIEQIREPFNVRLSRAIQQKQRIRQGQSVAQEYTFQPQVGRSPYYQPLRGNRQGKENEPVWQQLYKQSQIRAKKKEGLSQNKSSNQLTANGTNSQSSFDSLNHNTSKNSLIDKAKASSSLHYENLVQKRICHVFQLLDSDEDGIVSPQKIGIQKLTKNILLFLKPIFQEMDELNAQLNFDEFKKALINLLNDSDPYKKGLFLSDCNKKTSNEPSFTPNLSKKTKMMTEGRTSSQIHRQLYEQGVRNQKKKQFMLQKQRAKKQQKQLQQCSFKPCLHLGGKNYHLHLFDKDLSDIKFSVNISSNSNKQAQDSSRNVYADNQDDY